MHNTLKKGRGGCPKDTTAVAKDTTAEAKAGNTEAKTPTEVKLPTPKEENMKKKKHGGKGVKGKRGSTGGSGSSASKSAKKGKRRRLMLAERCNESCSDESCCGDSGELYTNQDYGQFLVPGRCGSCDSDERMFSYSPNNDRNAYQDIICESCSDNSNRSCSRPQRRKRSCSRRHYSSYSCDDSNDSRSRCSKKRSRKSCKKPCRRPMPICVRPRSHRKTKKEVIIV